MDCFNFLWHPRPRPTDSALPTERRHPGNVGSPPTFSQLQFLPASTLEEALRALPINIEISTAAGVAFSNRGGAARKCPGEIATATVVPLAGGVTLKFWGDFHVAATPTGTQSGSINLGKCTVPAVAPVIDDTYKVDLESIPIPAWVAKVANGALVTLRINTRWAALFGVPPGDTPLRVWRDAVHPDDVARVTENLRQAITTGVEYDSESRIRRAADGKFIWYRGHAKPLRDSTGAVVAYVGATMDIDDAVRDKNRLVVEQALLESVLDQMPVGIFIRRADGLSVFNRKIREIWQLTDSTIRHLTSSGESSQYFSSRASHVDGRPFPASEMPLFRAFHGEVVSHEEMHYKPDGFNTRLISASAAPVFGHSAEIVAAVAVIEDVTDARAREAEQLRLREEERVAKIATKAQSDFIANMSHELRSPVHGILGLVELLTLTVAETGVSDTPSLAVSPRAPTSRGRDSSNAATQRQYCSAIRECAMLLQSLVSSVLDFSKINAGLMSLEFLPLDLVSVVDRSILMLLAPARERGVVMSREACADFPVTLFGDELRLQQIIVNLANNALKFCHGAAGGGKVVIRVSRAPASWGWNDEAGSSGVLEPGAQIVSMPESPSQPRKCFVLVEVEDNGPGVPPDVAARLFKPFTQADSTISRRFGGTGLGLSIVRGLASLMGGSARVVSPNAMGGATFSCCVAMGEQQLGVPVTSSPDLEPSADSSERAVSETAKPDPLLGARILVVDDIRINRLIAQRFLLAHGATVDLAEDGKAGLEAVASAQPPYDVVLMDCQMPVLDGYAATCAIRALPDASRALVPIIAISASVLQSDIDKCIAAGMSGHVAKPIESAALAACVRRWAPRH